MALDLEVDHERSPGGQRLARGLEDAAEVGVARRAARVFTSGEFGDRARDGLRRRRVAAHDDARRPAAPPRRRPRSRSRAGAAARPSPRRARSSSASPAATRTPEAPFASTNTVSLVESWPSTADAVERALHAARPRAGRASRRRRAASVCTKQNIVAKRGEIMPAPFACADSRTVPARELHLEAGALGPAVGGHDRRGEARRARGRAPRDAVRTPASTRLARQLEADHARGRDAHLRGLDPERARRRAAAIAARRLEPALAVADVRAAALATTARSRSSVGLAARRSPARPRARCVVKRAADTVSGASRHQHAHVEPLAA